MLSIFVYVRLVFVAQLLRENGRGKENLVSVTLRRRKLPSGKVQLFLDVYWHGSRRAEFIGLFLNGDRNERIYESLSPVAVRLLRRWFFPCD